MADLTDAEFEIVKKCWRHSPAQAWEPRGGTRTPNIRRLVEAGYLRVVDGICGFERLKDAMVTWTEPARRLMPILMAPEQEFGQDLEQANSAGHLAPQPKEAAEAAMAELADAVSFLDRVRSLGEDERLAVGTDHWDRLEAAARRLSAFHAPMTAMPASNPAAEAAGSSSADASANP